MRRFFYVALLSLLAACAGDKYPFAPQFIAPEAIDAQAIGAPPANGSATYEKEIRDILKRQKRLNTHQKDVLVAENTITPAMIVQPVLGAQYTEADYPELYTLLREAGSDAWRISDAVEDYWQSPRPWYADARVKPLVHPLTRPGYPSGHTTTNTVWAYVLSECFPAKREALLARANAIGYHRVDAGMHFPHDVEGGKKLAALIYVRMQQNPEYRAAVAAARAELAAHATR